MRLLLPALLLTACDPLPPADGIDAPGIPDVAVRYEIRSDSIAWASNAGEMRVEDYPSGWRAHWACAMYRGEYQQVWVSLPVEGGAWVKAEPRHVEVSRCWTDAPCRECCPCDAEGKPLGG